MEGGARGPALGSGRPDARLRSTRARLQSTRGSAPVDPRLGSGRPALGSGRPALGSGRPALGSSRPALGAGAHAPLRRRTFHEERRPPGRAVSRARRARLGARRANARHGSSALTRSARLLVPLRRRFASRQPRIDVTDRRWRQCAGVLPGGAGTQRPTTHVLGEMQSTLLWHGKAHLPYWTLQWWVPHGTSF